MSAEGPFVERRQGDRRRGDRRGAADLASHNVASLCTARERQTLALLLLGMTNKQIAQDLRIAEDTVKKHVQNILLKLGVETRLAAALRATEVLGLAGVDPAKFHAD